MFLTSIFQTTWAQDSLHRETSVQVSRQSVSISDVFESNCEVHYLVAIRWSIDCRLHETSSASPPMAVFLLLIHLFIHIETTGLIFGENAEDQNVWIPQLDSQQAFQQWHDSTKLKKTAWRHNWTQNICQPTTIQCFGGFFLGSADVLSQNELPLSGPAPLRWKGSEDGCADTRPQWAEERRTKWPATVCFLPKENSCFSLLPLILFKGPGRVWQLEGNRDRVTRGTGLWFGGNDNKWQRVDVKKCWIVCDPKLLMLMH